MPTGALVEVRACEPRNHRQEPVVRLRPMEAVFISLMVLVLLLTGFVALMVLYKLFKTGS